jgi:hypothetical protein
MLNLTGQGKFQLPPPVRELEIQDKELEV